LNPEEEKKERTAPENAGERKPAPEKGRSVLRYIAVLFAAAFFLLLLSYLMQQRQMAETVSELKGSVSAMGTIENMRKTNEELSAANESLENENRELEDRLENAADEKSQLSTSWTPRAARAARFRCSGSSPRLTARKSTHSAVRSWRTSRRLRSICRPKPSTGRCPLPRNTRKS
jgi:cell division protein FtsB